MKNEKKNTQENKDNQKKNTRRARETEGIKQKISDELVLFAEKTKDRISKNFGEFLRVKNWNNKDTINNLYPFVTSSSHVSKLLSGDNQVSLAMLVVLHKEYGVDLNEFIAGDKTERPAISLEQVETLRAIVEMYDTFSKKS